MANVVPTAGSVAVAEPLPEVLEVVAGPREVEATGGGDCCAALGVGDGSCLCDIFPTLSDEFFDEGSVECARVGGSRRSAKVVVVAWAADAGARGGHSRPRTSRGP